MSEVTGMSSDDAEMTDREVSDQPSAGTSAQPELAVSGGLSAGALLRQARQAKGLHIAALAVSLKVPQRKLEALEADRYAELTDVTFVRALAQTICRALDVDPVPVLALLPQTLDPTLGRVAGGLNQPFRERPGREDSMRLTWVRRPGPLVAVALLLASAAVYLAPADLWPTLGGGAADRVTQLVTAAPTSSSDGIFPPGANPPVNAVAEPVVSALPEASASAAASAVSDVPSPALTPVPAPAEVSVKTGPLQLHANAQTWVEVVDANGQTLMSRNLDSGEVLGLDGAMPLKIRIGNAAGVDVQFRGQAVDLTPYTRANVARLELK